VCLDEKVAFTSKVIKNSQLMDYMVSLHFYRFYILGCRRGSVAGPVIQAIGRSEFEDGLGSDDFVSDHSYHMSVHTRLPDLTKQTKFQSQRPSDVKNTCSL
jgi:hypothetical protein